MDTITPSPARTGGIAAATADKFRPINPELRDRLEDYKRRTGETNPGLGRKLGYPDGTAVSKYLGDKYDRDPGDMESRLEDFFAAEARRAVAGATEVIGTSVVRQFGSFANAVRRANAVGVFHSPAGLGKSTAVADYLARNPTALGISANAAQFDAKGVRQLFWSAVSHRGYTPNQSRWEFLVSKFRDSGRLVIVDNAQRLAGSGRDFVFDFRDVTGCPVVLVGNPAILQRVAGNDQQFSRTLMEHEATLKDTDAVARQIVDAHTDEGAAIYDLALPIVRRRGGGHLRSLVMTLTAMREFIDPEAPDTRRAFESALAKSIHARG